MRASRRATLAAITAGAGAGTGTGTIVATGAIGADTRTLVPLAAQLIGGSISATTLAALRLSDDVRGNWEEVEVWLALGSRPRQAVARLARLAAARALVPLSTRPATSASWSCSAARRRWRPDGCKLLVLVGLLAAETAAAALVTSLLPPLHPGPAPQDARD